MRDPGEGSGLPAPAELRAGAAVLEREGLAAVARVLRLAAEAEEAVRIRLEAPNAPLFGDLTSVLPALLRSLPGRVPLFYSPFVAAMLSILGARRANGEVQAFDEVVTALSPHAEVHPGKGRPGHGPTPLGDARRDAEDLAYFGALLADLRRLDKETRGLRGASIILGRSSRPVRPELATALSWARRTGSGRLRLRRLAAWVWDRTRASKGRTYVASSLPAVVFDEKAAGLAVVNLRALEGRVKRRGTVTNTPDMSARHDTAQGGKMAPVENARERAKKRPKGDTPDARARHHRTRTRGPLRMEAADRPREPRAGGDAAIPEGREPNPVQGPRRRGVGARALVPIDGRGDRPRRGLKWTPP